MNDQQVPWAKHRHALVWCKHTKSWHEATGMFASKVERVWQIAGLDDVGEPRGQWWVDAGVATRLLHGQCPTCFELVWHAEGCAYGKRVAAALARGVPAFYAPWVMWTWPPLSAYTLDGPPVLVRVLNVRTGNLVSVFGAEAGSESSEPLVALSLGGFTLAPWGLS